MRRCELAFAYTRFKPCSLRGLESSLRVRQQCFRADDALLRSDQFCLRLPYLFLRRGLCGYGYLVAGALVIDSLPRTSARL